MFKGMFRGPLVLQTFGAHWTAVTGARKLDGVDDPNRPVGKPIRGLGLAAASIHSIPPYNAILISLIIPG